MSAWRNPQKYSNGFTLPELLICLAILGVIASFTIPKILNGQTTQRNNAVAKEAIATVSAAYQRLQLDTSGTIPTSTTPGALTQYMNYVATDSTSSIDAYPTSPQTTYACASYNCIRLHNGALMLYQSTQSFASNSNYFYMYLDPDGVISSQKDSLIITVHASGKVATFTDITALSAYTPSWFNY